MENNNTTAPNGFTVEQNKIITKVYTLFSDSISVYKTWGFYMFDESFNNEQELRNRIGIIILASLFDPLVSIKKLDNYREEAKENNLIHLDRYFNQIIEYFDSIKDLLSKYTKEEQVFIDYLRNQYVHSFLGGRHNPTYGIKYIVNKDLIKETLSNNEFHDLTRGMFENNNLDKLQKVIIDKWLNIGYKYSSIITELLSCENIIRDSIYHGREFQFKHLKAWK